MGGGGWDYALGDAYERPGFRPKSFPQQGEGFLVFFGALGRRLGARLTTEL